MESCFDTYHMRSLWASRSCVGVGFVDRCNLRGADVDQTGPMLGVGVLPVLSEADSDGAAGRSDVIVGRFCWLHPSGNHTHRVLGGGCSNGGGVNVLHTCPRAQWVYPTMAASGCRLVFGFLAQRDAQDSSDRSTLISPHPWSRTRDAIGTAALRRSPSWTVSCTTSTEGTSRYTGRAR